MKGTHGHACGNPSPECSVVSDSSLACRYNDSTQVYDFVRQDTHKGTVECIAFSNVCWSPMVWFVLGLSGE